MNCDEKGGDEVALSLRLLLDSWILRIRNYWLLIVIATSGSLLYAQMDLWQYNHSISIEEFTYSSGINYYISWSSSYDDSWEHDIYKQIVTFDDYGTLITDGPERYIGDGGNDEAQEPVSIAFDPINNLFISTWEDGSGSSIDVRGQIHTSDGSIIRENWILAGGSDAQHSPSAVYCNRYFVIAYTDEAPPAQHAMNKIIVLDPNTGDLIHQLDLTAEAEDHWWPVSETNSRSHSLTIWTNGENILGSIITPDTSTVSVTDSQFYISNISLYHYSVSWLEELKRYIIVSSSSNGDDIYACLVDSIGNRTFYTVFQDITIPGEVTLATHWSATNQYYEVIFPANENDIGIMVITEESMEFGTIINGNSVSILSDISWPEAGGVACQVVKNNSGLDLYTDRKLTLIGFNDINSNDAIVLPIEIGGLKIRNDFLPEGFTLYSSYPNPFNPTTTLRYDLPEDALVNITIYDMMGRRISTLVSSQQTAGYKSVQWNATNDLGHSVSAGMYIYTIQAGDFRQTRKMVLLK